MQQLVAHGWQGNPRAEQPPGESAQAADAQSDRAVGARELPKAKLQTVSGLSFLTTSCEDIRNPSYVGFISE